ncbi:MAG: septation protein A [Alphaproteobacteria bacterium]|nr:septation protein A [Alphaproteobacteria bacterium]
MNPLTKLGLDLGPLLVFFTANALYGIFPATAAFMVAIVASLTATWILAREIPPMPLITAAFVLVFGGLTLYLNDDVFIKLKPTIVNGLFAAILFTGLARQQSLLKPLLQSVMELTTQGWRLLTWRWAWFFVVLAIANELVWRNFSTDFWISFKLFGVLPLTIAFGAAQIGLMRRYATPTDEVLTEGAE